jgi:aminomethyltransferase
MSETSDELVTTALTDRHHDLGAKMAPFAGWSMPLEYEGTLAEHRAVRAGVGVFDVSHLGTVWITGTDAEAAVASTFTNDPARLDDRQSQYTLCCDDTGGIVDDLIVYRIAANRFMVVPNAANTPAVVSRLERAAAQHTDATVRDESREHAILAVQGPGALDLVAGVVGLDPRDVPYLGLAEVELHGESVVLCRTGYTGEPGVELVLPNPAARPTFDALLEGGAVPAGLGARDTLRLEMGYPLHGNDISRSTHPYEARLGWAVKLDRGAFTGQDALRAAKERGPGRRLLGLVTEGRRPLRAGMTVRRDGESVGELTSGGFSPTLEVGIGLAYLADPIAAGDEVVVDVRGRQLPASVVRPPFVERDPKGD